MISLEVAFVLSTAAPRSGGISWSLCSTSRIWRAAVRTACCTEADEGPCTPECFPETERQACCSGKAHNNQVLLEDEVLLRVTEKEIQEKVLVSSCSVNPRLQPWYSTVSKKHAKSCTDLRQQLNSPDEWMKYLTAWTHVDLNMCSTVRLNMLTYALCFSPHTFLISC